MNFYQGMLFLEGFRVLPEHAAGPRPAGAAPPRVRVDPAAAIPANRPGASFRRAPPPAPIATALTAAGGCD